MLLTNVIKECWDTPWNIAAHVEKIRKLLEVCNGRVTHIFREGNKLADYLANYALDNGSIECEISELDSMRRRIVNDDKLQCPNLRIKVARS